jgi:hypothetical protein
MKLFNYFLIFQNNLCLISKFGNSTPVIVIIFYFNKRKITLVFTNKQDIIGISLLGWLKAAKIINYGPNNSFYEIYLKKTTDPYIKKIIF